MSTSKYIIYECSICKRKTEILLDARRPDPVRCNITLHCRGTLSKSGERTSKGFLFTPLVSGLDDYIPRGQEIKVVPTVKTPSPITVFTGTNIMTMACFRREVDEDNHVSFWTRDVGGSKLIVETPTTPNIPYPLNAKVVVSVFELTPALLKFKRYVYNVGVGSQLIRGIDDSPEGKNLRFDSFNTIKVYLNGLELDYTQYDRSVVNQITMTPEITTPNSILEVLVWDEIPETIPTTDLIELNFIPLTRSNTDLSYRDLNCWGDYAAADFTQIENPSAPLTMPDNDKSIRTLLYCLDLTDLDYTKSYGIARVEVAAAGFGSKIQLSPGEYYLMLGKEPFLFQDKELHAYVTGAKLTNASTVLNFSQSIATGAYEMVVDQSLITQKFNPIKPVLPISGAESSIQTTESTVFGTEELKRKYILGPS